MRGWRVPLPSARDYLGVIVLSSFSYYVTRYQYWVCSVSKVKPLVVVSDPFGPKNSIRRAQFFHMCLVW